MSNKYSNLVSVIDRVIYYNEKSKWGVLSVKNPLENDSVFPDKKILLTGNFEKVYSGCEIVFSGKPVNNAKYGIQLSILSLKPNKDVRNKEGIINFLQKSGIRGISTQNAKKIYDKFGENSIKVVLHETERLKEIKGIGEGTYQEVINSVEEYKRIERLLEFCLKLGIPYSVIHKLNNIFGDSALSVLQNNIYTILEWSDEFTFTSIDEIAMKMGKHKEDPERLIAAIIHCTKTQVMMSSSTGIALSDLKSMFAKVTGVYDTSAFTTTLNRLVDMNKVIVKGNYVYWKYYFDKEELSSILIKNLLEQPLQSSIDVSDIEAQIEVFENNRGFKLNEQQVNAIIGILSSRIAVLTGGPGTGKTTITEVITKVLHKADIPFYLLSPTGKATRRLAECTHFPAQTIHKFLHATSGSLDNVKPPVLPQDAVIIVDECSMMDIFMLTALLLLNAQTPKCIYFIGDADQLPSVQVGNVLSDVINSGIIPVFKLTDIMRQSADSHIIKYCADINKGEMVYPCNYKDFIYTEYFDEVDLLDDLAATYMREVNANSLRDVQVIAPYKGGPLGVLNLNKLLAENYNKTHKRYSSGYAVGDKIMQIRNDYSHGVFNGECGVISHIVEDEDGSPLCYYVQFDETAVKYDSTNVDDIMLSYASTCHKSQGAEFPVVFVILDDTSGNFLLTRRLLYTAVSRGKKKVYIYSRPGCLKKCIKNDYETPRVTNMEKLLGEYHDIEHEMEKIREIYMEDDDIEEVPF